MAAHRKAFPTPRGATGGCPPDTVCGGAPATPEGTGKATRRAALRGFRGDKGGVPPAIRYAGDAPAAPGVVARRLWCMHTKAQRAPSRKPRNAVVWVQFS